MKQAALLQLALNLACRTVNEWGEVFPDPVIATAAIDKIFNRAIVLKFGGESYRLKGQISSKVVDSRIDKI